MSIDNTLKLLPLTEQQRAEMRAEIVGPFNTRATQDELGKEPTPDEQVEHYIFHGGVEAFRRNNNVPFLA